MTTPHLRTLLGRSPLRLGFLLITLALACFALLPTAQAVVPTPDGGYPGGNTAEGTSALFSLTSGVWNTALGNLALNHDTTGGANTATGFQSLFNNTTGSQNTANGSHSLFQNVSGSFNTATGYHALYTNNSSENTANGAYALVSNFGGLNTAIGCRALSHNELGGGNTGIGASALFNSVTVSTDTARRQNAVTGVTTASNVIAIGTAGNDVNDSCYIGNIFGATSSGGITVFINSDGQLGTATSSERFKDAIKPMDRASELLFALKPVTFRYKKEIDPAGASQFGLVAEEVEKVNPDLVVRDKRGKPYSVRYDQVNAMLLNEFLKEHKRNEEQGATITALKANDAKQEATIALQQKQIEALTKGIQKVSAQLELSKAVPQTVVNNQ